MVDSCGSNYNCTSRGGVALASYTPSCFWAPRFLGLTRWATWLSPSFRGLKIR